MNEPFTVQEAPAIYQVLLDTPRVRQGYKQTEVGVIPEDWDAGNLGLFWGVTDCKHVTATFVQNGIPLASIKEVQSRFIDLTNAKQTTEQYYSQLIEGGRKPMPGDLIISRNATVGETSQVSEWHPRFAMGQDVCLLRKKSSEHSTDYLQSVFQSPIITNQLANLMVGSTFKRVNVEQIRNFVVPMPVPKEQQAIATVLSDVDALLAAQDKLIAKKRDIKQAAMQQLLTGKQRLPGFTGEWEDTCLGEVIDVLADYTANGSFESLKNNVKYYESRNFSVLVRTTDLDKVIFHPERFTDEKGYKFLSKTSLFGGEIVIANVGSIGKVFRVPFFEMPMTLAPNTYLLKFNTRACEDYIYQWMKTEEFYLKLISKIGSTTLQAINKDNLRSIDLRIPSSVEEQTAIATVLSDMDIGIFAVEQQREKTRALKQGMMQELLTGRIRLV
jgi:type I restriction enzyme S subunit